MSTRRSGTSRRGRRIALVLGCLALVVAGGSYWYWPRGVDTARAARPAGRAPVPVSIVVATRQDIPIYLTGLGTVQASFTVRIHPQVDGRLQEVLFKEGQRVKKGDVLAKLDPRLFQAALDQARAKKAQDEAQLVGAEKDFARASALVSRNYGTQQSVDQLLAKVDQLKASIEADIAAIETAQTQLDYTTITAPSDGRIGMRLVDPGNLVRATDPGGIANLVLLQPSAVIFTLPSRAHADVREAMARGAVEVVAFDQTNRRVLGIGTLLLVDNTIDAATSTIRLKAMFPNEDEKLWPGDFVNARLLVETRRDVIAVPSSAVQRGPSGLFAWIITPNNTAEPRRIEVGPSTGDLTIVTSGMSEGEGVVTDGQYKLQRNAAVTITTPVSGRVD